MKLCGPAVLSNETIITELVDQVQVILKKQHTSQLDLEEEEDMPDLQESAEYDWVLIDTAMDLTIGMAAALGPAYREIFGNFEKPIIRYASSSEATERSTTVGVIADTIRYMEGGVTNFTTVSLSLPFWKS